MTLNTQDAYNGTGHSGMNVAGLKILLHALAHEVESQAYLQLAVRGCEDADLKAFLLTILGEEQLHETLLRSKLREKYQLDV